MGKVKEMFYKNLEVGTRKPKTYTWGNEKQGNRGNGKNALHHNLHYTKAKHFLELGFYKVSTDIGVFVLHHDSQTAP